MLFDRAAVDLSRSTLNYVAGLIRRGRKAIGSPWRLLNPGQQALLVLVYLRKDETFAEIAMGFQVSVSTAWRYVEETVMLLSARSPKLTQALRKAKRDALTHLILDGTLIPTDRVRADRPPLLRQAPCPQHERAGHGGTGRGRSCGRRGLCRARSTTWPPPGYGAPCASWSGPTEPTPSSAGRVNARTRSSNHGASYANCAAARTRSATSSRPSPSSRTTASLRPQHKDEMGSVIYAEDQSSNADVASS